MIKNTPVILLYRNRTRRALFLKGQRHYATYINLRCPKVIVPRGSQLTFIGAVTVTFGEVHLYQKFREILDDNRDMQYVLKCHDVYERRKNRKRLHFAVVRKMMTERGFWLTAGR